MTLHNRRNPGAARVVLTTSAVAWLAACATSAPMDKTSAQAKPTAEAAPPARSPKPTYGSFGVDTAGMDTSVAPGDNFYRFVNGTWQDKVEIPADRSSYGMFTTLAEEASRRTRALIEESAGANAPEGSEVRKLGDLFASFMDEAAIEAKGLTPLAPELGRIAAIANRKELAATLGDTLRADVDPLNTGHVSTDRLLGLWVSEDLNEPSRYAAYLMQGGLGLPDRDYYLVDNERFTEVRQKYQQHIAAMLRLAGITDPEARAKRILELERDI